MITTISPESLTNNLRRLIEYSTLRLGYRPSKSCVEKALLRYVLEQEGTTPESLLALSHKLFPATREDA